MIVRERVLASRLIEKINANSRYAEQLGIQYKIVPAKGTTNEIDRQEPGKDFYEQNSRGIYTNSGN